MNLLCIDSSARAGRSDQQAHGSHTRRLSAGFLHRWKARRPHDRVVHRDVGLHPPAPVTGDWVRAAFTRPEQRDQRMRETLRESDALVDELIASELIVIAAPMYNFGMPAPLKAWIDNVVRVGRTSLRPRPGRGAVLADAGRTGPATGPAGRARRFRL